MNKTPLILAGAVSVLSACNAPVVKPGKTPDKMSVEISMPVTAVRKDISKDVEAAIRKSAKLDEDFMESYRGRGAQFEYCTTQVKPVDTCVGEMVDRTKELTSGPAYAECEEIHLKSFTGTLKAQAKCKEEKLQRINRPETVLEYYEESNACVEGLISCMESAGDDDKYHEFQRKEIERLNQDGSRPKYDIK